VGNGTGSADADRFAGPIRGELLGAEGLAEQARALARQQRIQPAAAQTGRRARVAPPPLLRRLDETRRILESVRDTLSEASERDSDISPAGEWLLDNFYVIEEHLREIREGMPKGYYRELPKLASGTLAGYPRVYEVAIALIGHTEGHVQFENIELFVREFQRGARLTTGELWAVPTMLRLGLMENIRRMALRTVQRLDDVDAADHWAQRLREASDAGAQPLATELATFIDQHPPLKPAFIARFLQQIRTYQTNFTPLVWLEQWIAEDGMSAEEAVARSNQRLALTQVVMANSITSLRTIARLDWSWFVESLSGTEAVLLRDPSDAYPRMTFATRDRYRHVVEDIAKNSPLEEREVAARALELAQRAAVAHPAGATPIVSHDGAASADPRTAHIGYYLVDSGRSLLEAAVGYRPPWRDRLYRWVLRHGDMVYFGGIAAVTLALLAIALLIVGPMSLRREIAVLLVSLIPANEVAISIIHQLITLYIPPRMLAKLDYADGIPTEARTAVVVPTLLGSVEAVNEALEHLEIQFLANRDPNVSFALLSDFTDAPTETREGDAAILDAAVKGIEALNARYRAEVSAESDGAASDDPFFLFHRPREWNPRQGVWMAWERKRGKLAQFNAYLRGGARGAFSTIVGDTRPLAGVRYVITLDSDTVLPRGSAGLLIGAMAHPLNRAVYDQRSGRVVRGYGILQPRVGISLASTNRSIFASIHSGHPGVDPYTIAVSDVYQDLFGEGSFTGKGIYDVDAFERATHGRFPENTLLSHDLIEGTYARAALATDVEFYDDYPTRYLTYTRRKHRWIRGDWQLLRWLGRVVPGPDGPTRNQLSAISRWKIFDNLRRSVVEIALVSLLVAGWTILPGGPGLWTGLVLAAIVAPWAFSIVLAFVQVPTGKSWPEYYKAVGRDAMVSLQQATLAVTFLPHQAVVSADAIARTLWRLLVTKRCLLEWQTASQVERVLGQGSPRELWRRMWPAAAVAGVMGVLAVLHDAVSQHHGTPAAVFAVPLVALWVVSPLIANSLSAPVARRELTLGVSEAATALRYALLHWRYFDQFVSADTQWLAPDNFQEDPAPALAMRTSPTNIGLQLLGTVSACDLGFIPSGAMIERLELAFRSLERMQRFRGHFYNWYDLRTLKVLEPAYLSTVDSGNLAGHLIALKHACVAVANAPLFDRHVWDALQTGLTMAADELRGLASSGQIDNPGQWQAILEAAERVRAVLASLPQRTHAASGMATLQTLHDRLRTAERVLQDRGGDANKDQASAWLTWGRTLLERNVAELTAAGVSLTSPEPPPSLREAAQAPGPGGEYAREQIRRLEALADRADAYVSEMDFRFLFDARRKLFSIGYQVSTGTLDASCYDLLASESRLASFVAIAKHDIPVEHWFRLGRGLTAMGGDTTLISWSGSMFEYLMPPLVMRPFPFTLLDQTYNGAVRRHIAYGRERGVPWGMSESAYNARDRALVYQYRAFGVPTLALKRGLSKDLVVAPYATLLALAVEPHQAMRNLAALETQGSLGLYGFRDAVDYTRPAPGAKWAIVGAYMAHHVGMGLVALTNALTKGVWLNRFHADPLVRSAELMLFERIPRLFVLQAAQSADIEEKPRRGVVAVEKPSARAVETADTPEPRITLLGHLPYTAVVTNGGGGYTRFEGMAVTRWQADGTLDRSGQWCYVKDVTPPAAAIDSVLGVRASASVAAAGAGSPKLWSATHQPVGVAADSYRVTFAADRATFERVDGDIETRLEVTVVPEDAAEVRRVTLTNRGATPRELELTSYAEIVLAPPETDRSHPAFSNLFVQTEWVPAHSAIVASRRPRSSADRAAWGVHVVAVGRELVGPVTCETDRAVFIGRNRSVRSPAALDDSANGVLSGTAGAVLDPVFSLRARVRVAPGQSVRVAFTTLVAADRERATELSDRYNDPYSAQRALDLSWMQAQVELRELGIVPADAALYQEIAGYLLYATPAVRASQRELAQVPGGQDALWAHGLSGDNPILLAIVDSVTGIATVRDLLAAHHYWRRKGLTIDLVLLNTYPSSYLQELNDALLTAVMASSEASLLDKPGGVTILRRDLMPPNDVATLRAVARVHVPCDGRRLAEVLEVPEAPQEVPTPFEALNPTGRGVVSPATLAAAAVRGTGGRRPEAEYPNGLGRLVRDGAYEVRLAGGATTPAPWSNVIANSRAGCIVSESGGSCTFVENSFFYRLTPWRNDPVTDPCTDVVYLRDDETGDVWSATPQPIRHATPYVVRHEPGRTEFRHTHAGVTTALAIGMAGEDPLRLSLLTLTNDTAAPRRLTVTTFAEWTLGVSREQTSDHVRTTFDRETDAIFAQNGYDPQYSGLVAFAALSEPVTSYTGDRREFLGRNGDVADPAGLRRAHLGDTTGAGLDPCATLQCLVTLDPGETKSVVTLLGAATGEPAARALIAAYRSARSVEQALAAGRAAWRKRLSVIEVRTPDAELNAMLNGWLLYQALACRMWARTATYQSSGAYGFRDQLQDCMAFVYAESALAREHIVRSAGRQFVEGDVQHWWHPQSGRGVRTRFSDDLVWLPFVTDHYVAVTGDASVLDEKAPYLTTRALAPGEVELYNRPEESGSTGTVYEHCLLALRRASTVGAHGLPLIGCGDWNDGFSRVGIEGRGESVWLAWFLATTLRRFARLCDARGDTSASAELRSAADAYVAAIEQTSWDGAWYRRAYFDDGSPLGSASSAECKIDSIAQSWSVISGAAQADRAHIAMQSLEQYLVREDSRLIMLLTPPFDKTEHDPGYIKGYLPGVRENGAQYTHAATWTVLARAMLGDGDRAFALFQMLNPLTHSRSAEDVARYKVEPYVVAADVYTAAGHLGRGGWTWYTGSASWLYRVGLEAIVGFTKRGDRLTIDPCIPSAWDGFQLTYTHGQSQYHIAVRNPHHVSRGVAAVTIDGEAVLDRAVVLVDDGRSHEVVVELA